ncbi:MAG: hypothetical protein ACHQ0J_11655 [Candidatus Dormibacterales bacterium]
MKSSYRYRSFIWPAFFILAGLLALLVNVGTVSVDSLYQLIDLWPLILIVSGLEIIVQRSLRGRAADLAAALIVLLAVAGAVAYVAAAPNLRATHTLNTSDSVSRLDHVSLEVDAGAATINISGGGSLDGSLYKAHIEYSGPTPKISLDRTTDKLRISQSSPDSTLFQNNKFVLNLTVSSVVTWGITANSGASTATFDLAEVNVSSLQVNTGASREDVRLGSPSGMVPVTVNGGVVAVHIHRPAGAAASIRVSGAAVNLDADGHQSHTIGHASYDTPGFADARDGYRIEVNGAACTVTLD